MSTSPLPSAGLFRRLASMVYDAFLLFAIAIAYGAFLLIVRVTFTDLETATNNQLSPPLQWVAFAGLYLAMSSYFFVCWRTRGQTLGMKSWRLKLQQKNGDILSWSQCWQRSLLAPLSLICGGIGYLWCLIPPAKTCLHDILTHTEVVVLPKKK